MQISTAYGAQKEGSPVLPRNKYIAIRDDKTKSNDEAKRAEFKVCKFATDAIVTEGKPKADASFKAQQEKERREAAIANVTGIRILEAITAAVPVRLMKRDLLFVVERLAALLDENRLAVIARQYGIKQAKENESIGKLFAAYLRRTEESILGGLLVQITILHAATRQNSRQVLLDAATAYKVDTNAIALKVKQEFAAREKTRDGKRAPTKAVSAKLKKTA